jgi:hypothetical protein
MDETSWLESGVTRCPARDHRGCKSGGIYSGPEGSNGSYFLNARFISLDDLTPDKRGAKGTCVD